MTRILRLKNHDYVRKNKNLPLRRGLAQGQLGLGDS